MTDRDLGYDLDIDGLVARGLARYRAGDIDGALTAWEHVLALDPAEPRALGYVDYVRQNYDELVGADAPMAEMLIPFGLGRSDDDEYEVSITHDDDETRPAPERAPEPSIDDGWGLDAESEPNWLARASMVATEIELEADEPSDADRAAVTPFDDEMTRDFLHDRRAGHLPFDELGESMGGGNPAGFAGRAGGNGPRGIDFGNEVSTSGGPTLVRGISSEPAGEASGEPPGEAIDEPADQVADETGDRTLDFDHARGDFGTDFTGERTTERAAARLAPEVLRGLGIAPPGERPSTSDEETRQHWPRALDLELAAPTGDPDSELAIESLEPPPANERFERFEDQGTADLKGRLTLEDASVEVVDLMLPSPGNSTNQVDDDTGDTGGRHRPLPVEEALTAGLSASIDDNAPARESPDERARRRITALLTRAEIASKAGEHPVAVAAIDLALSEGPDLASAQKLVHRSRDLILDCYYRFFGDLGRRPVGVASFDELTRRTLDSRAAFLLSRIDGALSFEEILDVAGMGRLEACRHLAHLLWRGIIRVE